MGGKHYDKSWAKDNKNWSPWRGSWRSARTGSYDRGQRQSSSAFPSYDSQWLAADSIEVVAETRTKEPHPDGSVKAVQAAINQVRKADARVLKIQKDQRDKTQMWETYERKLRASFLQEKKKHAEAMTKLAGELVEAATEQATTREAMGKAAALLSGGGIPQLEAVDTDWDELMDAHPTATRPAALHQQVDELLRSAPAVPAGPLLSPGLDTHGPTAGGVSAAPGCVPTPRTYNSVSPGHARVDPYQTHSPPVGRWETLHQASFGPVRGASPVEATVSGARPGLEHGVPAKAGGAPVMGQGTPAPSLADSLANARRMAMASGKGQWPP